jgi:hypothetical protein
MSVFTTAFIGSTPVGNTLIGVAAELSSTRVAVLLAGSMTLLIGLIAAGVVLAGRVPDAIDVNAERAPQPVLDNHD